MPVDFKFLLLFDMISVRICWSLHVFLVITVHLFADHHCLSVDHCPWKLTSTYKPFYDQCLSVSWLLPVSLLTAVRLFADHHCPSADYCLRLFVVITQTSVSFSSVTRSFRLSPRTVYSSFMFSFRCGSLFLWLYFKKKKIVFFLYWTQVINDK